MWGQVATATATNGNSYVVAYYANSKYYALPHGSSAAVWSGTEVSLNAIGKVNTSTASSLAWKLTEGTTSGQFYLTYSIDNSTKYLQKSGGTGNNNKLNIATSSNTDYLWEFTLNNGNNDYTVKSLKNISSGTTGASLIYLGYTTVGQYGMYGSSNAAKIILLEIGDVPSDPSSEATFSETTPSINFPGTTTYSQTATTASGYTGTVTYEITANTAGATLEGSTVTVTKEGSVTVKATAPAITGWSASEATYTLTVTDTRADAEFSFDKASYSCDKFIAFVAPTLKTADGFDGTPVYESSDESVATVDSRTGEVTIKAVGTTTISVHSDATTNFQAGDAEYELTVTIHEGLDPINPAGVGRYVKVTKTEDITDGNYLIVYEGDATHDAVAFDGSRETLDAESNTIAVEISEGVIAATDVTNAAVFTIDVTAGTIKSASDFYIGVPSNSNGLKQTEDAETYTHTFSIDNESGNAIITAVFEGSSMTMQYNYANNQLRFRYYKSGQQAVQLYKYEAGSAASVTLSADGYKTMVGTQPFSASGANIYIVTATDTEKATMTKITKAPANTPVILKGESNAEVSLSVEDAGDNASANLLQISTESTGNGVYVLAKKDDVVAFYEWDGGSLGTGRVYLPKPASGDAREMISFYFEDEETTGINTTLTTNERMNNEVYNLNGQRVAQPTKGLYIVNGKKYIVK